MGLESIFDQLDRSQRGYVDIPDLGTPIDMSKIGPRLPTEIQAVVQQPDKLLDMFEYLDTDNSGTVDKHEFIDGVGHLVLTSVPMELTQIIQLVRTTRSMMTHLQG